MLATSQDLIDELDGVWRRPRLARRIDAEDAERLLEQIYVRGELVKPTTIPPRCRDPKDHPVLAAAIDGHADAILTGDTDLRADDDLRAAMRQYGVEIWGIERFLERIELE